MASKLKPRAISGFPEWLPHQKLYEEECIDKIRQVFRSFGFTPLETPAVELTEVLAAKGVEQKEIYSLVRLNAEEGEEQKKELSLHFDLTVPFARYVSLNKDKLVFPFKRYQIQKVWRGERPAAGRFREFYQCDIDVVGMEQLPLEYDAELLQAIGRVFEQLQLGNLTFRINHRKLLDGFYRSLGLDDEALRAKVLLEVDKLEKTGRDSVSKELTEKLGLTSDKVDAILDFAARRGPLKEINQVLSGIEIDDPDYSLGLEELKKIALWVPEIPGLSLEYDASITRGLNYYTGAVFESVLSGAESIGSIVSGGRYETLATQFGNAKCPGVGLSIGLTRLLSWVFQQDQITTKSTPTSVLVCIFEEAQRPELIDLCDEIRKKGLCVELASGSKLKKQLTYANKKQIDRVVIPNEGQSFELKDMQSGEQHSELSRQDLIDRL